LAWLRELQVPLVQKRRPLSIFEKPPSEEGLLTVMNTVAAFEKKANKAGLYAISINRLCFFHMKLKKTNLWTLYQS